MTTSSDELFLRPTVIGGESREGDYEVIWDGFSIGRIYSTHGVGGHDIWNWGVILPNVPQLPDHRGSAANLEDAKLLFKAAWLRVLSRMSDADIAEARRISQDRSRPCHERPE